MKQQALFKFAHADGDERLPLLLLLLRFLRFLLLVNSIT
jgi:hypothetical protein